MKAFKLIQPTDDMTLRQGRLTIVIAESRVQAFDLAHDHARAKGHDATWLAKAEVIEFDLDRAGVTCWVELG